MPGIHRCAPTTGAAGPPPRRPDGDYRLEILPSIHAIAADEWNTLVGAGAVTRSHAYLAAAEAAAVGNCRYYYPVVRDRAGRLLVHACVYVIDTDFLQLMPRWVAAAARWLRHWWPRLLSARITECACPLVAGSSISVAAEIPRVRAVALVEEAMRDIARASDSGCLVLRDFAREERADCAVLLERGYKRVANRPLAWVPVRWPTHAAYLDAMRARYRKDLKRRLARAKAAGCRVVVHERFAADGERWAAQVAAVHAHTAGFKREQVNAAYYAAFEGLPGAETLLLGVERAGRCLAHGMVIRDDRRTIATFFGREPGPPNGEWFLLMNEVMRLGITRGSREIWLGFGSYDAKGLVGADLRALEVYTRCVNPLLNVLVKCLPDFMRAEGGRARRVFRRPPTPV